MNRKRNLQLAKLADFNKPGLKYRKRYQRTNLQILNLDENTNEFDPLSNNDAKSELDLDENSFLEWFDDIDTTQSSSKSTSDEQECKGAYMLDKTYVDKILETRIVCLGNYSLVKACNIVHPFWVLSGRLKLSQPHKRKCECNQIPKNSKRIGEFYDDVHCETKSKKAANDLFAKRTFLNNFEGDILYLDSDSMFTTKMLVAKQVSGPKHVVNYDPWVINQLLKTNYRMDVIPQFGTMLQLITNFSTPLKAVWFDYCGRFSGSEVCHPPSDIEKLFESNRLTNMSILAFTFTLRDFKRGKFASKGQKIVKNIRECAKKYSYQLSKIKPLRYNAMFFMICNCDKIVK
jgi:hypothetical protein